MILRENWTAALVVPSPGIPCAGASSCRLPWAPSAEPPGRIPPPVSRSKILGVEGARELAEVMAAVGLAQNLAALRALVTDGIQRGHMALHARQIAVAAGAAPDQVDRIAARLVQEGQVREERARQILSDEKS